MCSPPGHREEAFERPRDPGQADGELQLGPLSFFGVSQLLNVWQEPFLEHSISLPHRSPLDLGFPLNRVRVFGFLPSKSLQSEVMVAWLYLFSFPGTRGPASTAQQPQLRVRHGFPGGGQMGRLASAPTLFNRLFCLPTKYPASARLSPPAPYQPAPPPCHLQPALSRGCWALKGLGPFSFMTGNRMKGGWQLVWATVAICLVGRHQGGSYAFTPSRTAGLKPFVWWTGRGQRQLLCVWTKLAVAYWGNLHARLSTPQTTSCG